MPTFSSVNLKKKLLNFQLQVLQSIFIDLLANDMWTTIMAVVILTKISSDRKIEVSPQSKYNIDLSRHNENVMSKAMIKSLTNKWMDKASSFCPVKTHI